MNKKLWIGIAVGAGLGIAYAVNARGNKRSRWDAREMSKRLADQREDLIERGKEMMDRIRVIYDEGRKVVEDAGELWSHGRKLIKA
jgi:uncharacterized coiled-coil DUF342 family protein